MSGIETIKIIVNAEKEAAQILADAQKRASEIRKHLDSRIREQHEEMLRNARKEAASLVQEAEVKGRAEAAAYEKQAEKDVSEILTGASSRKNQAVDKVVEVVLGSKN